MPEGALGMRTERRCTLGGAASVLEVEVHGTIVIVELLRVSRQYG
jgi:hypothetical protein